MASSYLFPQQTWNLNPLRAALPHEYLNSSFSSEASSSHDLKSPFDPASPALSSATSIRDDRSLGEVTMDPYTRRERGRDDWDDYRGRRSPGPYNRRPPGRLRSRSPVQIDRYQPSRDRDRDRDYDAPRERPDRRGEYRRRSPPPRKDIDRYTPGDDGPPLPEQPIINPVPDPLKLDYQVGFSFYAEWWRKEQQRKEQQERIKTGKRAPPARLKSEQEAKEEREKEHAQIQEAYDRYKEKLQLTMAKAFVHQHKDEQWFKERYDPDIRAPFRQRQATLRRENFARWMEDVDNGTFDDFTLEGIYKNDSNGAGGVVEKEEGETMAATEVLGVGDLVPMKGGELRDERAEQPSLLIKTIAPHVSREQVEAFCKEHLGEGEGGFKWLSLSDPNPQKKFHRIGWIILNPGDDIEVPADTDQSNGHDAGAEDGEDGEDKMKDDSKPKTKMITAVEKALSDINGKTIEIENSDKGGFTCHVGLHTPQSQMRKKALWDLFSAPERVERDLQLAERIASKFEQELGEDINGVNKIEERVEDLRSKGELQPQTNGSSTKQKNQEMDEDEDEGMVDEEEGAWDEDNDDEDLITKKKKLDMLVEYLRRVHNFCFFCVFESDSVHELVRKCPGGHLRRPRASLTTAAKSCAKASAYGEEFPLKRQDQSEDVNMEGSSPVAERPQRFQKNNKMHVQLQRAFTWVKTYEDKLFQILEPDAADLVKLGGRPLEEALDEELKKFVKQEDEAKFRCRVPDCSKLFKGENFWRKHIEKRHEDWYSSLKKELNEINLYVLDPAHIQPSRSDATSNGHFATNPLGPSGTPRGFSLQTMGMPGFLPGYGGMSAGLPGMSGMSMDGSGPMRSRGGGRYQHRSGPYDRPPRGGGGRRPMRNDRGPPLGGFPDATQGNTPREATAGRSLKSYEDLDAVGGPSGAASTGGGGERPSGGSGGDSALDY